MVSILTKSPEPEVKDPCILFGSNRIPFLCKLYIASVNCASKTMLPQVVVIENVIENSIVASIADRIISYSISRHMSCFWIIHSNLGNPATRSHNHNPSPEVYSLESLETKELWRWPGLHKLPRTNSCLVSLGSRPLNSPFPQKASGSRTAPVIQ